MPSRKKWTIITSNWFDTYAQGEPIEVSFWIWKGQWITLSGASSEPTYGLTLTHDDNFSSVTGNDQTGDTVSIVDLPAGTSISINATLKESDDTEYSFKEWVNADTGETISEQSTSVAMPEGNLTLKATGSSEPKYKIFVTVKYGTSDYSDYVKEGSKYSTHVSSTTVSENTYGWLEYVDKDGADKTHEVHPWPKDAQYPSNPQYKYVGPPEWSPTGGTITESETYVNAKFKKVPISCMKLGIKSIDKYYLGGTPVLKLWFIDENKKPHVLYDITP